MKKLLFLTVMMVATSAYADYFGCTLNVNGVSASAEAPYRGREVEVELATYKCEAVINSEIVVTTKVTNLLMGSYAEASGRASSDVNFETFNPSTNQFDQVVCSCGLN